MPSQHGFRAPVRRRSPLPTTVCTLLSLLIPAHYARLCGDPETYAELSGVERSAQKGVWSDKEGRRSLKYSYLKLCAAEI